MASAQVLPGSRKQEHLEAGKRRLEEFRKKKAAERAKKAATTSQSNASDASQDQKKPLETEHEWIMNSDGAGTSDGPGGAVETFAMSANSDSNKNDISKEVEQRFSKDADTDLLSLSKSFTGDFQQHTSNDSFGRYNAYGHSEAVGSDPGAHIESQSALPYRSLSDHSVALQTQPSHDFDSNSSQSSIYDMELLQSKENSSFWKDSLFKSPMSHVYSSSPNATIFQQQPKPSYLSPLENGVESIQPNSTMNGSRLEVQNDMNGSKQLNEHANTNFGQRNYGSLPGGYGASVQMSESMGFSSNVSRSSNNTLMYMSTSETPASRSHPSFLDSLNVPRASLGTSSRQTDSQKGIFVSHDKNFNGVDELGSSIFQKPLLEDETAGPFTRLKPQSAPSVFDHPSIFSMPSTNGSDLLSSNSDRKHMERNHEYYSPKQDEGFAALEQHIEDLTQEKFSLQRALEASRALADSLAAENSSLTDSYNQQRGVVNQLKSDMEKLQEEIKEHLVELEAVKIEYANVQLECNAADERAKLLASEVIGLEEKALRLRSSELKLERQLEDLQSEMTSYRKRMSSLEREHQDLQLTIDALQEEKKLLQSKLRKASASSISIDASRSPNNKKDVSTTTEDLDATPGTSNLGDQDDASVIGSDNPKFPVLPENLLLNLEDSSVYIPPDQLRMIQNINSLISELALEKEELMQALASESSQCSKLKDLNKELSRKLESQTQRLELLTAQSMVNENTQMRLPDSHIVLDNPTYADEGDEVVERVLGWIMKLFPGGPSKRRTSKLL